MRKQWEDRQRRSHGCEYVDGICVAHNSVRIASETEPLCTCRSFPHLHELQLHDALPGRFAGDTELTRFEDEAATDWLTLEERQPQGEQLQLIDEACQAPGEGRRVQSASVAKSA